MIQPIPDVLVGSARDTGRVPAQLAIAYDDRHAGQAANLAAGVRPHRDDTARVTAAVEQLARRGEPFTADDVHELVSRDGGGPYDPNLVSSVLGHWARPPRPRIVALPCHPVPSRRRTRRGSRNRVWIAADVLIKEPRP